MIKILKRIIPTSIKEYLKSIIFKHITYSNLDHSKVADSGIKDKRDSINASLRDKDISFVYENVADSSILSDSFPPALKNEKRKEYYLERYPLKSRHIKFYNLISSSIDLAGKTVLEIGGSNTPIELAIKDIGAAKWICVDKPEKGDLDRYAEHYGEAGLYNFKDNPLSNVLASKDYAIYDEFADDMPKSFYGKFDVVISQCSFEHIIELPTVLDLIYNVLKPGGIMLSWFGTIFSSFRGAHFGKTDEALNFSLSLQDLPRDLWHAHLLMGYAELYNFVAEKYGEPVAKKYIYSFKNCRIGGINRLFYEDYVFLMSRSPFEKKAVYPFLTDKLEPERMHILQAMYPGYKRFDVRSLVIQGIKSSDGTLL